MLNVNFIVNSKYLLIILFTFTILMAQPQIFQDSIEYYQSIIKKAPNNESAWFGLQKSFLHIGDIKFAQQLTKYDLSDRLLWGHIRVLFYAHQFDTIPRFITELATKFPKSPYLNDALELGILITETKSSDADLKIYARAHLDYEIGDYDNAIKDCKQLIVKTNKVSEYAYLLLERIYRAKKEINQSIATLDEFVQRFPESHLNPKARYELGLIYLESLKDTARARTVLEDLITDFPFSIPAFFARAKLAIIDTEGKKESKIK